MRPSKRQRTGSSSSDVIEIDPLPEGPLFNILNRLVANEIFFRAQFVCKSWMRLMMDKCMWRSVVITCDDEDRQTHNVCRRAVELSEGGMARLCLNGADVSIFQFILQRSNNLKSLSLVGCPFSLNGRIIADALHNFQQLEELHVSLIPSFDDADIRRIGISCPNLKSFTYSPHGFWYHDILEERPMFSYPGINECAIEIAQTMPNLSSLQLIGNPLNNEGLEAILDGCPKLISLDIRQCYDLNLHGGLQKRCCEQIRKLKLPWAHVSPDEYDNAHIFKDGKLDGLEDSPEDADTENVLEWFGDCDELSI